MWTAGAQPARLSVEGQVVQAGNAEHGVVDAVVFDTAATEDVPAFIRVKGVLDAAANSLAGAAVFLRPGRSSSPLVRRCGTTSPPAGAGLLTTPLGDYLDELAELSHRQAAEHAGAGSHGAWR